MRELFFDIGNTRAKLWWCRDGVVERRQAVLHQGDMAAVVVAATVEEPASPMALKGACVLGEEAEKEFVRACEATWQQVPRFARSTAVAAGVSNAYAVPERLGVDRWLGLIALQSCTTPVCVVSCGSAITLDVMQPGGGHEGGYILPGLIMMASALAQGTGQVRVDGLSWGSLSLGRSTTDAVANGSLAAAVALIEHMVGAAGAELVLTGGDAEHILPHLSCRVRHEPDLLLSGLQRYFADTDIKGPDAR